MPLQFIQKITSPFRQQAVIFFIFTVTSAVTGMLAVFYGQLFTILTEHAMARVQDSYQIARIRLQQPLINFLITPTLFVLSAYLCRKFAPNAAGSGPEHVMAALKKLDKIETREKGVHEYLSLRISIVKVLSSLLMIWGGGALGREGPVVQISASIFYEIGERAKRIVPIGDIRIWIIAGSAGGFAAAFNTPLAGIMFAIEELSEIHFANFRANLFWAVIIAGAVSQFFSGFYVLFGFPQLKLVWSSDLLVIILVSISCGVAAFILRKLIVSGRKILAKIPGMLWYIVPITGGLIVATIGYKVGPSTYGAGVISVKAMVNSSTNILHYSDVLGRYINVCITTLSGVAGGMLLPSIAMGGGIGSLLSQLAPTVDARIFITVGMAGFLGAFFHIPLTAAVLLLEITNQRELIIPLVLTAIVASWIYQRLTLFFSAKK